MQYIIIFILMVVFGVVSCMTDTTSTLGISGNEFLENYNEEVPDNLKIPILQERTYIALGPLFNTSPENEKYTFGCSYHRNKLRHVSLNYIYVLEPDKQPTKEGISKMERICLAAIDAIDDGWFTSEKDILESCGFYNHAPDGKWHEKDGICYLMFDNGICWGLQIRSENDTGENTGLPPIGYYLGTLAISDESKKISNGNEYTNNNSTSNEHAIKKATSTDKTDTSNSITNKYLSEQKTNLSLGGVDIGDSLGHVRSVLGQERSSQKKGDSTFLKYNHIEVEIRNDMVYSVLSENNEAMTKKGIHKGSDFSDVLSAYGKDYTQFAYDDLMIYEYKYNFKDGASGILRFAVNKSDNKVNYVGVRLPD